MIGNEKVRISWFFWSYCAEHDWFEIKWSMPIWN
ncbi:hypothetical protein SLEP1_g17218 [Rubroshorea leprosula]|uniref:Uncharacterized protein n=1 Tax=Rubroshorea leprosula TaxID=152421 RepID=A0AAV5J2R7_9ROSI|nr:hypothetical protein SLEP1_g17218 [Rubroshorea leprosula]